MKTAILKNIMPLAAGLMLFSGCATEQPAPATGPEMPPPPETEVIPPQPNLTYIWTPGFWDWQGRWVWVRGYWGPRPHPGAVWVQGQWVHRGHRNVWVRPHWQ
ncbi:MAG TPA: hypothetical protein VMF08_04680 [Candidatus Sulfotelmatobacter sp.]|nr:hypothetical protein [Candidatus Sulfotelmatobacter sp.]